VCPISHHRRIFRRLLDIWRWFFVVADPMQKRHVTISVPFDLNIDKVRHIMYQQRWIYPSSFNYQHCYFWGFCLTGLFFWISLRIKLGHLKVGLTKKISGDCRYEIFSTSNVDAQNETISSTSDNLTNGSTGYQRSQWRNPLAAVTTTSLSLSLSLRFNGHFPDGPGLAGVYWSKGWWRWW